MFFSAASPRTASTISLDIASVSGDEVGAFNLLVGDGQHAVRGGDRDLLLRGTDQLTGHGLVPGAGLAQANPRAADEEPAVVMGLGGRPVQPWWGHVEGGPVAVRDVMGG